MAKRGQSKYMSHMRAKAIAGQMGAYRQPGDALSQYEAMNAKAKTNAAKGKRGGDCNRTQCQRPNAWWYNKTMQAYYCADCAGAINESCLFKDHIVTFGSMVYVKPPVVQVEEFEEVCHVTITTADGLNTVYEFTNTKEEAEEAFEKACHITGLRPDGTPPFHYSELREKMLKLRGLIQERYPDVAMVEFV